MPINAGYEFFNAEKVYLAAKTIDEKIIALEEMIRAAPKHKSSENFVAELKTRLKKLIEKKEKAKKTGKTSQKGIRKEGFQCVIIGLANSGKSSLLTKITNARPRISSYPFTTMHPEIGTMDYEGVKAQLVETPSIDSVTYEVGMPHTADCLKIVIERVTDLAEIVKKLPRATQNRIIVFNKVDLLDENQTRKLQETIKSKKFRASWFHALQSQVYTS